MVDGFSFIHSNIHPLVCLQCTRVLTARKLNILQIIKKYINVKVFDNLKQTNYFYSFYLYGTLLYIVMFLQLGNITIIKLIKKKNTFIIKSCFYLYDQFLWNRFYKSL